MTRSYRKFDEDFRQGAVRLVFETAKPIAQVARELGVNEGTLGNWVVKARRDRDGGKRGADRGRAGGAGPAAAGEQRAADGARCANRTRRSTGSGMPRWTSGDVLAHRGFA